MDVSFDWDESHHFYEDEDFDLMNRVNYYSQQYDMMSDIKMEEDPIADFGNSPSMFASPNFMTFHSAMKEIKQEPNVQYTVSHTPAQITPVLADNNSTIGILIETQPPVEVRTRTPNEIRTFGVNAKVTGQFRKAGATIMKVSLHYAPNGTSAVEPVKKDILGGTKTVAIQSSGLAAFDNLTISESSTKNKEREFILQLSLIRNDGTEMLTKTTRPFYAYSHKKVLQRRGSVQLRTLSKSWGKFSGGDTMHVIGSPYIQGPALAIIFRTPHGDVVVKPSEFFSDSVLFFELPAYPMPRNVTLTPDAEIKVSVLLTNDGRTYSNALDFTYLADVSMIRSRI